MVGVDVEAAVPDHPEQAGVTDDEDLVAPGRQSGDGRFGQDATVHDGQGVRLQHDQLARLALTRCDRRTRPRAGEVLGDEVTVVQDDEPVVGPVAGQGGGGGDRQVGGQAVGVISEHHVQRAVGMDGHAAGPGGTPAQVGRAGHLGQGHRIDALDEGDGVVAERVAQQEQLTGIAGDGHGGGRYGPGRDLEGVPGGQTERSGRSSDLGTVGPAVLSRPRPRPVAAHGRAGGAPVGVTVPLTATVRGRPSARPRPPPWPAGRRDPGRRGAAGRTRTRSNTSAVARAPGPPAP